MGAETPPCWAGEIGELRAGRAGEIGELRAGRGGARTGAELQPDHEPRAAHVADHPGAEPPLQLPQPAKQLLACAAHDRRSIGAHIGAPCPLPPAAGAGGRKHGASVAGGGGGARTPLRRVGTEPLRLDHLQGGDRRGARDGVAAVGAAEAVGGLRGVRELRARAHLPYHTRLLSRRA
jgi:hypothetical protein